MRLSGALAIVAVTLVVAPSATAAAPNYILVSGRGLPHPVLLANWNENLQFLVALGNAPIASHAARGGLRGRPRFDLAEFWGWSGRPRPRGAAEADQHGTFYPAYRGRVAVVAITVDGITAPRLAPRQALTVLARHGIPTRMK